MGDADALPIQAAARVLGATLKAGTETSYGFDAGRVGYIVSAMGRVRVNGVQADARDGIAIRDVAEIRVEALEDSEIILVDAAA